MFNDFKEMKSWLNSEKYTHKSGPVFPISTDKERIIQYQSLDKLFIQRLKWSACCSDQVP